ncbi:MAG: L,D-transpeptidase family protein [Gammaproteobacteria bacterium]|nr:L,D-transpeptidase family protein [Gammaproteobacteria bacterium]MDH5345453.1 L,D-transpeptidase family protein [Gammaproteobacteria bacterium]
MKGIAGLCCLLALATAATARPDPTAIPERDRRTPAWFLEIPDTVTDILVADTSTATMHRFARAGADIVEIDRRYMSIGQNGPGKEKAWDRKTPLGVYFITESLDTSRLHDKYGVAAFPLDYPNAWDRFNERTGYGIWLHGVDHNNPERPPLDTDGCLALPNEEILRLTDRLQPLVTPVIVTREMRWADADDVARLREELRIALDLWRESMGSGDLLAYLSLYADDFRYRDMDRADWASWRLGVFESRKLDGVEVRDVMLVADPEAPDLYLTRFTQVLATGDGPVTTTKRLYWRRSAGSRWQIVSEDSG